MALLNIIKNLGFYKKNELDEEQFDKLLNVLDEKNVTYKVLYEDKKIEGIKIYNKIKYDELTSLIKNIKDNK